MKLTMPAKYDTPTQTTTKKSPISILDMEMSPVQNEADAFKP